MLLRANGNRALLATANVPARAGSGAGESRDQHLRDRQGEHAASRVCRNDSAVNIRRTSDTKRGSSCAKARCSDAASVKFNSFSPTR